MSVLDVVDGNSEGVMFAFVLDDEGSEEVTFVFVVGREVAVPVLVVVDVDRVGYIGEC